VSYLDELGEEIRRRVPPELLPDGDTGALFRLYAVLALAKGSQVQPEDVHNAWAAWMSDRDAGHRSIRPFLELDKATRHSDDPFLSAIRHVAAERRLSQP
jgi:hypothetical protein